jgi:hypothetical protein
MIRPGKIYLALIIVVAASALAGVLLAKRAPEAPVQPIDFSHRVHAGDNQIACLYCHSGASRSTAAGVPSVSTCYECHRMIKLKNIETQKVIDHWQQKQPIPWVRVYSLPDYVYFSHKRHVQKGIACQDCHGQVQTMERISQQASLNMGWCLECHEQRGGPRECDVCHK